MPHLIAATNMFATLGSSPHEIEQSQLQWPVGGKAMIAHAEFLTDRFHVPQVRPQPLQVFFASQMRVDIEVPSRFHVMKHIGPVEIERELSRIKHVEDDHFVSAGAEG